MAGVISFRRIVFLVLTAAILGCAGGGVFVDPETGQKYRYKDIEAQVKSFDSSADFFMLRLTFTRTGQYDPYDPKDELQSLRSAATDAQIRGENEEALRLARKALNMCYVDMRAHLVSARAHEALENADSSSFYYWTFENLLASIMATGDGLSQETAFLVIAVTEEYTLVNSLGLRTTHQTLIEDDDGHSFDLLQLTDMETGEKFDWYFDITIPMGHLQQHLN